MCNNDSNCGCVYDILERILDLQQQDNITTCFSGCDKPYLGPSCVPICYNTRPVSLYNCSNGLPWSFQFTRNGVIEESSVFRVEALDDCCCTCRILYLAENGQYAATGECFTLDLRCVGAIRCLPDTFVELC